MLAWLPAPDPIAGTLLGYLFILLVPGPNLLAVGTIAGLHGLRVALPACLGMALGAGVLVTGVAVALAPLAAEPAVRILGALALLGTAAWLARRRPAGSGGATAGGCLAGFATAATNPVTAGYFAAQVSGPLAGLSVLPFLPLTVAGVVLAWLVGCAAVMSLPTARRRFAERERPARRAATVVMAALAATQLAAALADLSGAG